MRKWFIALLLVSPLFLTAQKTYNVDSLEALIHGAGDSLKASLLYKVAKQEYNRDPDKCMNYAEEAASLAEKTGDSALQAMSYQIVGVIYKNRGDFDKAMDYQVRAARILENIGNKMMLASSYNDLGVLNKNLGNFDKAIVYYKKSLEIIDEAGIEKFSALLLNNIGTIYDAKKDLDSAEFYYLQALEICERIDNVSGKALTYNNLGELYAKGKKYQKAKEYFQKTLEIDISDNNKMGMLYSYLNLAGAQADLNENASAMINYREAEKLALETDAQPLLSQVYKGLSRLYEKSGNFRESLDFYKKFKEIQDSVFDDNRIKQLEDLQAKYESDQKEKEIKMLSQENEIGQLKITEQRGQITVLALAVILIFGAGAFLLYRNRQKHRAILQEERIRQKEKGMKAVFSAQEEERKRIAKDLHDGIGQTLSGLKLSWASLSSSIEKEIPKQTEQLNELTVILDDACQEVRTISHQMMPRQLSESGLVPAIQDMLDKSFSKSSVGYSFEHFGVEGRFAENVEIALFRITQELVNNVIKHSGASKVAVQLIKSQKFLVLIVEDNGKGFDAKEKASGIGLLNIASRIDTINGEVNYEPSPGSGTIATVRVPVKV